MRKCFRDTMLKLAAADDRLLLLLGDISVYLFKEFQDRFPRRFFNVGICENTQVSMAAGLSREGFHPIVHTITPFITERSYEQVKLDLCYNGVGGTLVTCGGSFDYAWDGATHHCYTDLELMRMLPRMEVMQPGNNREFAELLSARYASGNPNYLRIAGDEHGLDLPVEFGKGQVILSQEDAELTVITAGPLLKNVLAACANLPVNLLYFHKFLYTINLTICQVVIDFYSLLIYQSPALRCPLKPSPFYIPDSLCIRIHRRICHLRGLL